MKKAEQIILAITGATGMLYVPAFLKILENNRIRVHGIISEAGRKVLELELGIKSSELPGVERWFAIDDFTAPTASGSSLYDAMVILPCTVGTMGAIANGYSGNLIHRTADVTLKERRPLIMAVRETPLNRTHLKNMLDLTETGAVIYPPMPSYYHKPETLEDLANHFAGRLCDHLGIKDSGIKRWGN